MKKRHKTHDRQTETNEERTTERQRDNNKRHTE